MNRVAPLLALLVVAACDLPPDRVGHGPVALGSDPTDGDVDVDRAAGFRIYFDRALFPRDVHRGNVWVQSGTRSAFLSAWFEPVERVIYAENIGIPLDPLVRYRLVVEDVRDLDGEPMEGRYEATFETGTSLVGGTARPPVSYADVEPILAGCAVNGCHGGEHPSVGLDLGSPAGIRSTAIRVVARETRVGTQADLVWHGAPTLDGLAIIDVVGGVGRPARSYLMYKVLGDPHAAGDPMPPDAPLSAAELSSLSWWIHNGAPTD